MGTQSQPDCKTMVTVFGTNLSLPRTRCSLPDGAWAKGEC